MVLINPEPAVEPPVNKGQDRINRLYDLFEAETAIGAFLEEYKSLFPDEIKNFLIDIRIAVQDAQEET